MYAIKRHDLIFLIGRTGSAKSSLIRLVERTINKQMSTVNVSPSNGTKKKIFQSIKLNELHRIY